MAERTRGSGLTGELAAEFAGTMVLLLLGAGVVAQVVAGGGLTDPKGGLGNHDSISWAWGLAVTLGVYVAARLSGGHLNPAVTVSLAAFRGFPWRKVVPYSLAQTAGAFVAALIVRWNYTEVLARYDPGHTFKTQFVFSTLPGNGNPAAGVHEWGAFRDQVIGTAILLLLILAVTDMLNTPPGANLGPFIIGLIVVALGMAFGTNAGYAINPARDFGPRLASYLTGYGTAWRDQWGNLYFWVPIVGPLVGGLVGAAFYQYVVGRWMAAAEPEPAGSVPPSEQPG
ncbi:MIP/aquaporin family protein [Peterkaempfera bronchialis]|uniref:Aquaporin family protein n=1 Tax=Peterkaempfera bronchialis TaxID=2126346 RepID=A0A345T248_9ACTN|nr:MIP/aquaporin family protein [Peterkaempfera bronchialis]AXI80053.1 aquaporin family protein [Peterkaempfera bronchialis]